MKHNIKLWRVYFATDRLHDCPLDRVPDGAEQYCVRGDALAEKKVVAEI